MSKKLFLHIGSPKTGSTSIQEIFALNKKALKGQGYMYPGNNPDHHFLYFASKASRDKWPRHFKGMETNKLKSYITKYFSALENDFKRKENVVMSTEYIFFDNRGLVENIIDYLRQFFTEIKLYLFFKGTCRLL